MSQDRPPQLPASMTPKVAWQRVSAADVLGAMRSLGPLRAEGRIIDYRGQNVDSLLAWCFAELDLAERATTSDDAKRHASQVVVHAKKALDCLFDAYLERDFLTVRLRSRAQFTEKLELLKKRLGARIPWRLVPAVVADPRDTSEHSRVAPSVAQAGVAAEAAKVTAEAMTAASKPLHGPALVGSFEGGWSSGPWGHHTHVTSFPPQFAWIGPCNDDVARVGVGVRVAPDLKDVVEVQFAEVRQFTEAEHLELLRQWDTFEPGFWISQQALAEKIRLAGLDQPT